ncbi:hypothetical protein BH20ACT2_BH20ACT2_04680 [soil metagenome]
MEQTPTMKKTLLSGAAALALTAALASCTPQEFAAVAIHREFPEVEQQATAIAKCESGLDPAAVSPGGGNVGLFQINTVHRGLVADLGYSWDQLTDPSVNASVARVIYDQANGWGPWSCKRVL